MAYSNSSLVDYKKISPYRNSTRKNKTYNPSGAITKITIHHMAGNLSVETCGRVFQSSQSSSNYGIDSDGRVGMYVEEKDRSWASASPANDYLAVTIEVADWKSNGHWQVSDKAYAKLIDLCVDICKRNGIQKLNYTGDKTGNLTMHKWFIATACPGDWLEPKFKEIAEKVNEKLGATTPTPIPTPTPTPTKKKVIDEDGIWGKSTTKYTQKFFKTTADGIVSNQLKSCKTYLPGVQTTSWEFSAVGRGGSPMIKKLQKYVGTTVDGYMGKNSVKKLQQFLNKKGLYKGAIDGIMGTGTVTGWQKFINS